MLNAGEGVMVKEDLSLEQTKLLTYRLQNYEQTQNFFGAMPGAKDDE